MWIEAYINDNADAEKRDWQQLYDFAMVATQEDPNNRGSSLVEFEVNAITAVDPAFDQWSELRLDSTLGLRPATAPSVAGGAGGVRPRSTCTVVQHHGT